MSVLDRLVVFIGDKLALLFLLSVLVSLIEVVLRYVFNAPTIWAHETTILLCAVCFIYGGAYCLAQDSHIRITIVYDLLNEKIRRVLDIASLVLCTVYIAALSYAGWFVAHSSLFSPSGNWQPETSGSAWDPAIPAVVRCFLFAVLVVMFVQLCAQLVKHLLGEKRA